MESQLLDHAPEGFGGKLPGLVKMAISRNRIVATLLLVAAWSGCGRAKRDGILPPDQGLDAAVRPAAVVSALRRLSGAHFHATAMFRVSTVGAPDAGGRDAITTTTDLWIDKLGNFRLAESNDQDGGRDVVRVGSELAVALRYGKLIRRPAQDPEPQRFLEEAVGAPWAAWDTVGRFVEIGPAGGRAFRLSKAAQERPAPAGATALRKWRETVAVQALVGEARLDASGGLQAFSLNTRFRAMRDGTPVEGEIAVATSVDQADAPVTMPATETLQARQRTILEERALLGGLAVRTPTVPPAPKKAVGGRRSIAGAGSGRDSSGQPRKLPAAPTEGQKEAR
jgi:hypothetical protein